jgi:HlyD family secretion protein
LLGVGVLSERARSRAHANYVRSGLPGMAYVLTDPSTPWPDRLKVGS